MIVFVHHHYHVVGYVYITSPCLPELGLQFRSDTKISKALHCMTEFGFKTTVLEHL